MLARFWRWLRRTDELHRLRAQVDLADRLLLAAEHDVDVAVLHRIDNVVHLVDTARDLDELREDVARIEAR